MHSVVVLLTHTPVNKHIAINTHRDRWSRWGDVNPDNHFDFKGKCHDIKRSKRSVAAIIRLLLDVKRRASTVFNLSHGRNYDDDGGDEVEATAAVAADQWSSASTLTYAARTHTRTWTLDFRRELFTITNTCCAHVIKLILFNFPRFGFNCIQNK